MRKSLGIITLLFAAIVAPTATANVVVFTTPPGATSLGAMVDASATFTTGGGTVTIDLSNLLTAAQVIDVSQNISDVFFTLDNTSAAGSVSSSTGTFIDVASSGGAVTVVSSTLSGSDLIGWLVSNSGSDYDLNGLGALASPAQTIIGGTAGDTATPYLNANGSIAGNGPHNPFVQGTGEFVLSIPGVTAATNVSDVIFSFGTTAGNNVPSTPPVPEPASLSLLVVGLLGIFLVHRK
jgi:PEP-CTERM motif-containing protein